MLRCLISYSPPFALSFTVLFSVPVSVYVTLPVCFSLSFFLSLVNEILGYGAGPTSKAYLNQLKM